MKRERQREILETYIYIYVHIHIHTYSVIQYVVYIPLTNNYDIYIYIMGHDGVGRRREGGGLPALDLQVLLQVYNSNCVCMYVCMYVYMYIYT